MKKRVKVWDVPTRVFHWGLVVSVTGSIVTVKLGGDWLGVHALFGYVALGLLVFRVIWGVVGSTYSRFSNFLYPPKAVLRYMRGADKRQHLGHNPMGGLSVFAMLGVLGFQALSGLFTNDNIAFEGPLARFIRSDWSSTLTGLHQRNQWLIYGLIGLHIAAVLFYTLIKHKRLIPAMLHGQVSVLESLLTSRMTSRLDSRLSLRREYKPPRR
jgi:cytochrome b